MELSVAVGVGVGASDCLAETLEGGDGAGRFGCAGSEARAVLWVAGKSQQG